MKRKMFKSVNDFILGFFMLCIGVFLLFSSHITNNNVAVQTGGYFARADVFVRLLAFLITLFSFILIIKSIKFDKKEEKTFSFHFSVTKEIVLTVIVLIVYTLLLPIIGFTIDTLLFVFFLTLIYNRKENYEVWKIYTKKQLIRQVIFIGIYTFLLVFFVYIIFSKVLNVLLPTGILIESLLNL